MIFAFDFLNFLYVNEKLSVKKGNAKISVVRSLADICFLRVLMWLITCVILPFCVSVFLVLSILHTVI